MAGLTPPRPLTAEDNRYAFDCGRAALNHWFWRNAWQDQEANAWRTSVVRDPTADEIVGFVSLSAAQIERASLPEAPQRDWPDHFPAALLGHLAVDQRYQGRGYGRALLSFALTSVVRISANVGCFCVLTYPLDDGLRAFFRSVGFEALPCDPMHGMAVRTINLKHNGITAE